MSEFDFIFILISLILGLGITNLLAGVSRTFHRRRRDGIDDVHMVFTVATLVVLILNWWVEFSWRTQVHWSFDRFLVIVLWAISLYLMSAFLYPPDISETEQHRDIWVENRAGYYSAQISSIGFDILQTSLRGQLLHPVWYLPFMLHYALLAACGLVVARRGFDRFFGWYRLISVLVWALLVRRFLVANP